MDIVLVLALIGMEVISAVMRAIIVVLYHFLKYRISFVPAKPAPAPSPSTGNETFIPAPH